MESHIFFFFFNVESGMPWASDSEMNAESQENQALAYVNKNIH